MIEQRNNKKRRFSLFAKITFAILFAFIILAAAATYKLYRYAYMSNVDLGNEPTAFINIPSGSNYNDVKSILIEEDLLKNLKTFEWVAQKKNYPRHINPGKYIIIDGMSNNELINMLRSGKQHAVRLTFTNIRTKEQLAGFIAKRIEADSLSIINILNNDEVMKKYDLNSENASLMFIPNTYEVYWNTSAEELLNRMHSEYKKFWNEERLQKASNMNMTPQQVGVLASIVQQETNYLDEMDRIAGVYINRINMGMPLQADPTIVFAHGDFTINRVLKTHLEINSPYNTYINKGLPPGPISLPSPQAIDRVLNYEKHDYLYFCAKEDFSGYHAFAKTLQQHLINARRYQQELNYQKILR